MLLEVIAPLTSSECLCCSSTMHSEQSLRYTLWALELFFFVCVWKILISLPHVYFVLRITLEVWKCVIPHNTTTCKTEINNQMEMMGVSTCIVHVELPVERFFFPSDLRADENRWWQNNFRKEQWVWSLKMLAWKKNNLFSHKKKASRKKPL